MEAVEAGTVRLVGTDRAVIRYEVERLLTKPELYQAMASIANPYGQGNSATEIVDCIERWAAGEPLSEARTLQGWPAASNVA
jgi:UDP-N-acetylglucosamine 2-epimerase (non-hydrolysing)